MAAQSVSEAVERLRRCDSTLKYINLYDKQFTDSELGELVGCLLAHPDIVLEVYLAGNQLTDETGIKLARYVAASSTVNFLDMVDNQLGPATYLALAAALRVNSSLRELYLFGNQAVDRTRIDPAFEEALQLHPDRPAESKWCLYSSFQDDLPRLRDAASELGHPSLQQLLAARLLTDDQLAATQL